MSVLPARAQPAAPARIESIQALRGLSALLVVGYHFQEAINGVYAQGNLGAVLFGGGWVGVDLFFLISGFVMVFVTEKRTEARFTPFVLKRFFRVFPLAWLATLLFFFARGGTFATLPETKAAYWDPWFFGSLLTVTWTIRFELVFYLLFALAFVISHRHRTLLCSALIVLAVLAAQAYVGGPFSLDPDVAGVRLNTLPESVKNAPLLTIVNPLALEFIPGMLLAELYLRAARRERRWHDLLHLLAPIAITLFFAGYFSGFWNDPTRGGRVRFALPFCFLLLATLLFAELRTKLRFSLLLTRIGELSYSIYLAHLPVQALLKRYPRTADLRGWSALLLWSGATLAVSLLTYFVLERPLARAGQALARRVEQARSRPAASPAMTTQGSESPTS